MASVEAKAKGANGGKTRTAVAVHITRHRAHTPNEGSAGRFVDLAIGSLLVVDMRPSVATVSSPAGPVSRRRRAVVPRPAGHDLSSLDGAVGRNYRPDFEAETPSARHGHGPSGPDAGEHAGRPLHGLAANLAQGARRVGLELGAAHERLHERPRLVVADV